QRRKCWCKPRRIKTTRLGDKKRRGSRSSKKCERKRRNFSKEGRRCCRRSDDQMGTTALSAGQVVANLAGQLVRLDDVIVAMADIETQIHGCAVTVGFVFLVLGTMQGFFSGSPNKFFYQIVRSLVLVSMICGWNSIDGTIGAAVKSFRNYPVRI